jgi:hypothetical protein
MESDAGGEIPLRSAPEQKDSPVPVMIAARNVGSASNHSHSRMMSALIASGIELRFSGLLSVRSRISGVGNETRHPWTVGCCMLTAL